jgi:SH3 domain protein
LKIVNSLFTAFLLILSANSIAETRYISDEVFVYLHSGPSLDYRIIGTLKVGSKVSTLKYNKKTKFMQVKSSTGKVGWMKLAELQETLPAKNLLPVLKKELDDAQLALKNISDENAIKLSEKELVIQEQLGLVSKLKGETDRLNGDVINLKSRKLELELWQETRESQEKMNWMLEGGGFLLLGLLIGLIIPFLPRRKKRTSNW